MSTSEPVVWRAPGRINLIGEHTDYNDGFALPFAIEQACTATVARHAQRDILVSSTRRADPVHLAPGDLAPGVGGWAGYAAGVAWALARRGVDVPGLRIALDSTVPVGAGLSSSAAVVCSVTAAIDDLLGLGSTRAQLLEISRSVENDYVGAPTGGMDQLAVLNCEPGHALFCDMRTLEVTQVPLDLATAGLAILVVDTRTEHGHAGGEYRARREGCELAARLLGVHALRDLSSSDPDSVARLPSDELRRYARHVVTENERVLQTVELLRAGRLSEVGELLTRSHRSLRDDFRVSIPELDVAVQTLLAAGALGARMTGGGFGGCVIGLLGAELVDGASASVRAEFARAGFTEPGVFAAVASQGAHRVEATKVADTSQR